MSDMVLLTDAELDLVAGGSFQSYNTQINTSYITQYATAYSTNYGDVTATAYSGGTAVAVGSAAAATNLASVSQSNNISD